MKTLHLTNAWHPRSGGVRTFYMALFEAANARGHEMRLVVPSESSSVEHIGRHGLIYHVEAPSAPFSPSYRILYPHRALIPGSPVHRILIEEKPDLVELCDKFTLTYLGGLLRVGLAPGVEFRPAVVALSCERLDRTLSAYTKTGWLGGAFSRLFLRWLYFPLADHHIAVSRYVADELRAVADGHKVDRGVWIGPMGVDALTFGEATRSFEVRQKLLSLTGAEESAVILAYAGRLAREKNIPLLFETMTRLAAVDPARSYRLLLVGDGDARAELMRTAERILPGLVHFAGHCESGSELAGVLAACDLFVHPNFAEPFGIAPLEAMAAGLPLVAPDSGGVLSYASHENAWLAPPDAAPFADAIRGALDDPSERLRRTSRARQTALDHSWTAAANRYLDLYKDLHTRVLFERSESNLEPEFVSTR